MANKILNMDTSELPKPMKKELNKILKLMDKAKEVVKKVEFAVDSFEQKAKGSKNGWFYIICIGHRNMLPNIHD